MIEKEEIAFTNGEEIRIENVVIGKEYLVFVDGKNRKMKAVDNGVSLRFESLDESNFLNVDATVVRHIRDYVIAEKEELLYPNQEDIEKEAPVEIPVKKKPWFSVSLVSQKDNATTLQVYIAKSCLTKEEALGQAIFYFKDETKGLPLVCNVVIEIEN